MLVFSLLHKIHKPCLILDISFLLCQFCFFTSPPSGEYSKLLIVAAFSNKSFYGITSSLVKNPYIQTFPDDRAEISSVCLSE